MPQLIHAKAARKVRKSSARAAPARSQAETRNALRRGAASGSCLSAIRKLASASRELIAFPKLCLQKNALAASLILGVLWSIWHLPVTNYLGTATPHGASWFPFFVTFAAAMTAVRVLISWIYTNTNSVLLAQFMHVSSTASLVIFSPPSVTARQEVIW